MGIRNKMRFIWFTLGLVLFGLAVYADKIEADKKPEDVGSSSIEDADKPETYSSSWSKRGQPGRRYRPSYANHDNKHHHRYDDSSEEDHHYHYNPSKRYPGHDDYRHHRHGYDYDGYDSEYGYHHAKGPRGARGPEGAQGPPGPRGKSGAPGLPGPKGLSYYPKRYSHKHYSADDEKVEIKKDEE